MAAYFRDRDAQEHSSIQQARGLIKEIERFSSSSISETQLRKFHQKVLKELQLLENASRNPEAVDDNILCSSNIKFHMAVWEVAKSVPVLHTLFPGQRELDIIAGDGAGELYYVKVSAANTNRLRHNIHSLQWEGYAGSDSDDTEKLYDDSEPDVISKSLDKIVSPENLISQTSIAKMANKLIAAASRKGATPLLYLANIDEGDDLGLLKYLSTLPLKVSTKTDIPVIRDMSQSASMKIWNLDITTVNSLIADVCNNDRASNEELMAEYNSHAVYFARTKESIILEEKSPFLHDVLFPLLQNAEKILCGDAIFQKCRDIVNVSGSETEQKRASLLFAQDCFGSSLGLDFSTISRSQLIYHLQMLCAYPIPTTIPLPITILPPPSCDLRNVLDKQLIASLSSEGLEVFHAATTLNDCKTATANKHLARFLNVGFECELGIRGRVLLHEPKWLRGSKESRMRYEVKEREKEYVRGEQGDDRLYAVPKKMGKDE